MKAWDRLETCRREASGRRIASLFESDPERAKRFSAAFEDMLFDYSKTGIDDSAIELLLELANAADVAGKRDAMFAGAPINATEGKAVLHTVLRNPSGPPVSVDGVDVVPGVRATLEAMEHFVRSILSGKRRPASAPRFTDVVNIGIGGSHLGPEMACAALSPYAAGLRAHFISNADGANATDILASLDPQTTLVVVASKTFTTVETMLNAATVRRWLASAVGPVAAAGHFAAVSSATVRTREFGIPDDAVFGFGDWVGGRYSVWGPVGLSLMLAVGPERFREFLDGGRAIDEHFRAAPLDANLPVLLALVGIWNNQVCGHATRAVLPYDQRLARLPAYLQQLEMESNGKSVAVDGSRVGRQTGPVVWGEPGTNGQHAFHQLLHQGTQTVPCEFLVAANGHESELEAHHVMLLANCFAQSKALMEGRRAAGASHREFEGDRPSTTLVYDKLTPRALGRIVAMYEHRVFVEGAILGINSFDQWGVELGKELANSLTANIESGEAAAGTDGSTRSLLEHVRQLRAG